ncbi:MAG: hypothetical protein EA398_17170 [Deltaproteobacteria bacterium]|nr:MAG: hypothetical protein EA398_17170 [Deltaproteobacteria bacterium]
MSRLALLVCGACAAVVLAFAVAIAAADTTAADLLGDEPVPTRWPVPAFSAGETPPPRLLDGLRSPPPSPGERPLPPDHTPDFLARHGAAVGAPGQQPCAACHTEQQCSDCHAGQLAPIHLHPPGYLLLHGSDALHDTGSCASCHAPTLFCQSCHLEARTVPRPPGRPHPGTPIHPAGWTDPTSAVNHATEARRDILQCASCHTGDSCASCHIDISPHGSGFVARCGRMLDAGAPTCARCHTPTSRMPLPAVRNACGR